MLLAIDVGNSQTKFGLWDGEEWASVLRLETFESLPNWKPDGAICASVVPALNESLTQLCRERFQVELEFLKDGASVGLEVDYEPKEAVGADRIANALGALAQCTPPLIVVDFGTATNFDVVDHRGHFVGGAIMPGLVTGSEALLNRAAKLPHLSDMKLEAPPHAIGQSTLESLQSGIVLGYAEAVDGLVRMMSSELQGKPKVVATGGLGGMFVDLCETIESYEPTLTLDGLRVAYERLHR